VPGLVPRDNQEISKGTARELQKIDERAIIQAAISIRDKQRAEAVAKQRVRSNHHLFRTIMVEHAQSDDYLMALAEGKPGLEMIFRAFQKTAAIGDQATLIDLEDGSLLSEPKTGWGYYRGKHRKPKNRSRLSHNRGHRRGVPPHHPLGRRSPHPIHGRRHNFFCQSWPIFSV
jgi:hypothetical protein